MQGAGEEEENYLFYPGNRAVEEEENCFYPGKTIKLVWLAIYSGLLVPWFLRRAILVQTVPLMLLVSTLLKRQPHEK